MASELSDEETAKLGGPCPDCESGEVFEGSSIPDDEGWRTCIACNGTEVLPSLGDLRDLREKLLRVEGDLHVSDIERDHAVKGLREREADNEALGQRLEQLEGERDTLERWLETRNNSCERLEAEVESWKDLFRGRAGVPTLECGCPDLGAECVEPDSQVVRCTNHEWCGWHVHTCEKDKPAENDPLNSYVCPQHPKGLQEDDGRWYCSSACFYEVCAQERKSEVRELRRKLIRPQMLARQQADFDRYVYRIDTLEGIVRELREALRPFAVCKFAMRNDRGQRINEDCGSCEGCRARQLVERHGGSE